MGLKRTPTSLRISERVESYVASAAVRTHRTRSAVYESLLEEAVRARTFPGIAFRGQDWQRQPWVVGTGLDVWEIVQALKQSGGSVERLAAESELTEASIRLAAAYRDHFPDEIDQAIIENEQSIDDIARRYPTVLRA